MTLAELDALVVVGAVSALCVVAGVLGYYLTGGR